MKAVAWTDALQTVIMIGAVAVIIILGTISVGGPQIVFERNQQSGRLDFFK